MSTDKMRLYKGLKYEIIALPLIILAPVLITIGFKAIKHDDYAWISLGFLFAIVGVGLGFKGILLIVSAIFNTDKQ